MKRYSIILTTLFAAALSQNCEDFPDYYCVPLLQCIEGVIDRSGINLITIRNSLATPKPDPETNRIALSSSCPTIKETCCYLEPAVRVPGGVKKSEVGERITSANFQCGLYNPGGVEGLRGPGGSTADFGEYPHVCAILSSDVVNGERILQYEGGASLIAPGVLLTGAHVINEFSVNQIQVRCGEWNNGNRDEPLQHQSRSVDRVILHPEFNPESLHNNFGIVFVTEDFVLTKHISPVCLPDPVFTRANEEFYSDCIGTGWGKDDVDGDYAKILKEVRQSIVDRDTCENRMRKTALGRFFILDKSFICAGGVPSEDLCVGDGGSPLTCKGLDGSLYQLGLSSWGLKCNLAVPAAYSSTEFAACWIDEQVTCGLKDEEDGEFIPNSVFGFTSCGEINCK